MPRWTPSVVLEYATDGAKPVSKRTEPPMTRDDRIRCDACPVLCYIKDGMTGACDRYANEGGKLVRVDPVVVLDRGLAAQSELVPFLARGEAWDGDIVGGTPFVTAIG